MFKKLQAVALGVCLVLVSVAMQGCGCDEDKAAECLAGIATQAAAGLCDTDKFVECLSGIATQAAAGGCTYYASMVACIEDNSCCDEDGMKATLAPLAASCPGNECD